MMNYAQSITEQTLPNLAEAGWTVEMVGQDHVFFSLQSTWDELAGRENPFLCHAWQSTWWRSYRRGSDALHLLIVRDEQQEIRGIAPWYLERSLLHGKVLRQLGSGEVCSDYLTLLTSAADHAAVALAIANWLLAHSRQWSRLDLSGTKRDDLALNCLTKCLAAAGCRLDTRPDVNCWRTELPATFNDFLISLSSSRREKIRKSIRRTAEQLQTFEVETVDDLRTAFPILIDLHQKRRNSLSQIGCFASDRYGAFHTAVAEEMLAARRLRLRWITLGGVPAAIEYSFVGSDTVYYYQGGFEPALSEHRPGWLCFALALQNAIERGYRYFDFLRGDEGYKSSWNAEPIPLVRLNIYSTTPSARLRSRVSAGLRSAQSMIKTYWPQAKEATGEAPPAPGLPAASGVNPWQGAAPVR